MNLRETIDTLSRMVECMRGASREPDDEWDDTLAQAEELLEALEAEEHEAL